MCSSNGCIFALTGQILFSGQFEMSEIQIELIQTLQTEVALLEGPMKVFSILGHPGFFLLAIIFLYWCLNPRLGLRLALLMGMTLGLNLALKVAFHLPRPYWVSQDLRVLESSQSFGFPSAHAQGSATFWGLIAMDARRRWFSIFAVAMVVLIGVSRVYLGVHFPVDVLAGWAIGAAVLFGFLLLEGPVGRWIVAMPLYRQVFAAFAGSVVLFMPSLLAIIAIGDWQVPISWTAGALETSGVPIDPLSLHEAVMASGFFFGFAAGAAVLRRHEWMPTARNGFWVCLFCFIIGLVVAGAIYYGFGLLVPPDFLPAAYLQAAAVAVWVSWGAPILFSWLTRGVGDRGIEM